MNRRGQTFTEIMIGLALAGILLFGVTSLYLQLRKTDLKVTEKSIDENLISILIPRLDLDTVTGYSAPIYNALTHTITFQQSVDTTMVRGITYTVAPDTTCLKGRTCYKFIRTGAILPYGLNYARLEIPGFLNIRFCISPGMAGQVPRGPGSDCETLAAKYPLYFTEARSAKTMMWEFEYEGASNVNSSVVAVFDFANFSSCPTLPDETFKFCPYLDNRFDPPKRAILNLETK